MWAVREMLAQPVMRIVFPPAAISPGLPWMLILLQRREPDRRLSILTGLAQFGVVALNAVTSQWLQNREIAPFQNLASYPENLQIGATIVFLALFIAGLSLVAWMVAQIVAANRRAQDGPRATALTRWLR